VGTALALFAAACGPSGSATSAPGTGGGTATSAPGTGAPGTGGGTAGGYDPFKPDDALLTAA
jgi:hypothetical protein